MTRWSCKRAFCGAANCLTTLYFLISNWLRSLWWRMCHFGRVNHASNKSRTSCCCGLASRRDDPSLPFVLLEQYRHGPQQQNEWNLLLWRISFPLVVLVLLATFALAGQFGRGVYVWFVCSAWYFCSFCVVAYPFCLVYHFRELDGKRLARLWKLLAVVSVSISAMEWLVAAWPSSSSFAVGASRSARHRQNAGSMILGNTLFGLVAFVALPWFFQKLERVVRDHHDLGSANDDDNNNSFNTWLPSSAASLKVGGHASDVNTDLGPPKTSKSSSPRNVSTRAKGLVRNARLSLLSRGCLLVVWVIMVVSYTRHKRNSGTEWWMLAEMLSPGLVAVLYWALKNQRQKRYRFEYLVVYSVLVIHVPIFVGQLCLQLFTVVEASDLATGAGGHHNFAAATASKNSWLKLSISILYLVSMQSYFYVLLGIVSTLCEPFAYPSLLYMGQLYYYLFWYMLVGSDTPIDLVYWAMLLANNVHIALLNTGVYADVRRASSAHFQCMSKPMRTSLVQMQWRLQVASRHSMLCVRAVSCSNAAPAFHESLSRSPMPMQEEDPASPAFPSTSSDEPTLSSASSTPNFLCSTGDCKSTTARSHNRAGTPNTNTNTNSIGGSTTSSNEKLRALYFLMKVAEQDNMADTTALIVVPSLMTLLAWLEKPSSGLGVFDEQFNLWSRCVLMFFGRLGGAYLAREIFTFKLKQFWRQSGGVELAPSHHPLAEAEDMKAARLWIQRVMLTDFHRQFWYLMAVTIVVVFACFGHVDLPFRFALLV